MHKIVLVKIHICIVTILTCQELCEIMGRGKSEITQAVDPISSKFMQYTLSYLFSNRI
jgi:hypothetical protein